MKNNEISVYCWKCGKRITIEIQNVYTGKILCDECRKNKNDLDYKEGKE